MTKPYDSAVNGGKGQILTPEQIANWRKVLVGMIGPAALILPDEQIQAMRDRFQENIDRAHPTTPKRTP